MGKHIDVVPNAEIFQERYDSGVYSAPWVVYVGSDEGGYDVVYSSDEKRTLEDVDFAESIVRRVENLENEKVYCYEDEYEELLKNGSAWITNIKGNEVVREEVSYDPSKTYCIYEDELPSEPENEETLG